MQSSIAGGNSNKGISSKSGSATGRKQGAVGATAVLRWEEAAIVPSKTIIVEDARNNTRCATHADARIFAA
jgi:hypothetical protein